MAKFDASRMQTFVDFPEVEEKIRKSVEKRVEDIFLTEAKNGEREPLDVVFDYLNTPQWETRLKTLIGLSGGSLERLKRVANIIFGHSKWTNLQKDENARRTISEFLIFPERFSDKVPEFIRKCFYIRQGWVQTLRDRKQIEAIVINSLKANYATTCGLAQEAKIVKQVDKLGCSWEKGKVEIVNNKEVDVAIPNRDNPLILIMSSYQLTTSSNQSSRANEQTLMYEDILRHNRRKPKDKPVKLWNVIDGGGWLNRVNDLDKMLANADANFCNRDIDEGIFADELQKYIETNK